MKIKKKHWRVPKNATISFKGVVKPVGNSGLVIVPKDYVGCRVLVTILDDIENEEFEVVKTENQKIRG